MEIFVLDGTKMTDRETAHAYIARTLGFPAYYGGNLDALADCLSEMGRETCIVLTDRDEIEKKLGRVYADRMLGVFLEQSGCCGFQFMICDDI